ncbi:MAG: TraC family protein [Bdellovibrionales bacterium]|nr:TraC family protein [Bdellovibrionales bacterium]
MPKFPLPKILERGLSDESLFRLALLERPESLTSYLPYEEFIEADGLFRNKDGSLGAVFEVGLLEHEPMTAAQIIEAVEGLKSWFSLPENCTLQVLFEQRLVSPLDARLAEIEKSYPEGNEVSKKLFSAKVDAIKSACGDAADERAPFERRGLLSVRYFPEFAKTRIARDLLARGEATLFRQMRGYIEERNRFLDILRSLEGASTVELKRLGAADLVDTLRAFFNPKSYYRRKFAPASKHVSLSEQLLYSSPVLDFAGIEREGVKTRTITLKTTPAFAYPGGMAYFTKLDFPFRLSLNFSFPSKLKAKSFFDLKEFFLQNSLSARSRRQREEVLAVQDRLARDDRCLGLTFTVVVEAEDDETLARRVNEVVNIFHADLEAEVIIEDDIGLGLCLNQLPLNYTPRSDYSARRSIRVLRSDVTKFIPVFDSYRGTKNSLSIHLSRERNLVPFSLFENETSQHTVVLADSGSGKSAFVIDCVLAAKRMKPEPLVFVLDRKTSYAMCAKYFGGELTVFDSNEDMPFTPFRGEYDDEKISFLTMLLMTCVRIASPEAKLSSVHEGAISKALKNAYTEKLERAGLSYKGGKLIAGPVEEEIELSMDEVVLALGALSSDPMFKNSKVEIDELAKLLIPFYGDGHYAKYFKASSRSKVSGGASHGLFYIYDLDRLDSSPVLQPIVTMAVTEEIRRIMKLPQNRGRMGLIVCEEIGMLGRNNPTAAKFITEFAETCRKLGCWLIGLSPRPQNYFELEAGRAMWGVADNFVFLQMSADNVNYVLEHSEILDEATAQIAKSLRTKRGQYAEVLYLNKKKTRSGAFRYYQTPFDLWLAPTNARDFQEAVRALKEFMDDAWAALKYLTHAYPHGVPDTPPPLAA